MKRIFGAVLTAALATTLVAAPQSADAGKDQTTATTTGKKKAKKQPKQKHAKGAKTTETK
jgi:hypothetical protein